MYRLLGLVAAGFFLLVLIASAAAIVTFVANDGANDGSRTVREFTSNDQSLRRAAPAGGEEQDELTLRDGEYHVSPGETRRSIQRGQTLVGQSFFFNGMYACQVFGVIGPATVEILDGEFWLLEGSLSRDQLECLMDDAERNLISDPVSGCDEGDSNRTVIA